MYGEARGLILLLLVNISRPEITVIYDASCMTNYSAYLRKISIVTAALATTQLRTVPKIQLRVPTATITKNGSCRQEHDAFEEEVEDEDEDGEADYFDVV